MLGSLILYHKGMRIMMFQLSGFYCRVYIGVQGLPGPQEYVIRIIAFRRCWAIILHTFCWFR